MQAKRVSRNSTGRVKSKTIIDEVQATDGAPGSPSGLVIFVSFLRHGCISPQILPVFGGSHKSCNGHPVEEVVKHLLCSIMDDTSRPLVHFDNLSKGHVAGCPYDRKHYL
jgi:hypothetical protein